MRGAIPSLSFPAIVILLLPFSSIAIPTSHPNGRPIARRASDPGTLAALDTAQSCPVQDSTTDNGDASFYEPSDDVAQKLCVRGITRPSVNGTSPSASTDTCLDISTSTSTSSGQIPVWVDVDGGQVPYTRLEDADRTALWNAMGDAGRKLKSKLDSYVLRGVSRLTDTTSAQNAIFAKYYHELAGGRRTNYNVKVLDGLGDMLAQSGLGGLPLDQPASDYTETHYKPNANSYFFPVVSLAASPQNAMIVSTFSAAWCDGNEPAEKAYSSTITWNAWSNIAGSPAAARKLKYHVRHHVSNVASNNIMSMAHERYPGNVDLRPTVGGKTGPGSVELGPVNGHGRWTVKDEAWAHLLAAPNLKTIVEMLMDYNTEMDNPYPSVIHTFPKIDEDTAPDAARIDRRLAGIVIEYGSAPPKDSVPDSLQTA